MEQLLSSEARLLYKYVVRVTQAGEFVCEPQAVDPANRFVHFAKSTSCFHSISGSADMRSTSEDRKIDGFFEYCFALPNAQLMNVSQRWHSQNVGGHHALPHRCARRRPVGVRWLRP